MPVPQEPTDSGWDEALRRAVRHLGDGGQGSLLFLEEREDLRAELHTSAGRELVHTRLNGISARLGLDPYRHWHQSAPSPEDAERLARTAAGGEPDTAGLPSAPRGSVEGSRLDGKRALVELERLVEAVARTAGPAPVEVLARCVAFEQEVRVARRDRPLRVDLRRGRRVRVEVRLQRRAMVSVAVGERVMRSEDPGVLEVLARQVARRAEERLTARAAPAGEHAVVFAPGVGGILFHELVGHALEGDTVMLGGSILTRMESPVCSPELLVLDDPRRGRAAWRIDDEGEGAKATPLLQGGRVAGHLHDLRSARHSGRPPTGHARRSSYREPVRPRMGCTFLASGALEPEEVLEGIASGIHVRRMEAAAVDPVSGSASFRVTDADEIARGRLGAPYAPFLLKVRTEDVLRVDRVANDLAFDVCIGTCLRDGQPVAASVGAPTISIGLATVLT